MPLKNVSDLCGAKTRKGTLCENPAMPNGRCRMHSGKAKAGIEHPNFKTGRFSKHLPTGIAELYENSLSDRDLTEHRESIALVDALLADRLDKLYRGESVDFWKVLRSLHSNYMKDFQLFTFLSGDYDFSSSTADDEDFPSYIEERSTKEKNISGDQDKELDLEELTRIRLRMNRTLKEMSAVIERGFTTYFVFENVAPFLESRRRITESENRRLEKLGSMIPAEKAFLMVARLADIVNQYVTEPEQRRQISRQLAQTVTTG